MASFSCYPWWNISKASSTLNRTMQHHYSSCHLQNAKLYELVLLISGHFDHLKSCHKDLQMEGHLKILQFIIHQETQLVNKVLSLKCSYDLDDHFTKYRVNIVMLRKMSRRCWRNIVLFIQQMLQLMIMTIKMSLLLMFGRPVGRFQRNQMIIDVASVPPVRSYGEITHTDTDLHCYPR